MNGYRNFSSRIALIAGVLVAPGYSAFGQEASDFASGIETFEAFRTMAVECDYKDVTEKDLHATAALLYVYRRLLNNSFNYSNEEIDKFFEQGHKDGLYTKCGTVNFQRAMHKFRQALAQIRAQNETYEQLSNALDVEPYR